VEVIHAEAAVGDVHVGMDKQVVGWSWYAKGQKDCGLELVH